MGHVYFHTCVPVNNQAAAAMLVKYHIKDQVTYVGRGTINILYCFLYWSKLQITSFYIKPYKFCYCCWSDHICCGNTDKKCVKLKKNTASILDFSTCVQFDSVFACFWAYDLLYHRHPRNPRSTTRAIMLLPLGTYTLQLAKEPA